MTATLLISCNARVSVSKRRFLGKTLAQSTPLKAYRDFEICMQQRLEFKSVLIFILDNQGRSQSLFSKSNSVVKTERVGPG